jgi:glycosyltransferase involved in cell wall biosynthesis
VRLAWFSPWPPQPSGVAGRSAELVPLLAANGHGIDVFVDERHECKVTLDRDVSPDPPRPGEVRVQGAHDFVWRVARDQYDLSVYQFGNSALHQFIWPYAFRWPGLAVLHDARLHHARGRALLSTKQAAAYRAEFAWSHPEVDVDAAEVAVAGFDGAYYYLWPMVRAVVEASRYVGVHARGPAADLASRFPGHPIEYIALGSGRAVLPTPDERERWRRALGLDSSSPVFGVFGGLTAEKRVTHVLRAFRNTVGHEPHARLILAGASAGFDWRARAGWLGIDRAVSIFDDLDDESFERAIAAVDVSINLRWPTAHETSGPWLQALAAGRATIVTDLAHQIHLPTLDPRNWQPYRHGETAEPIAVAIDILDEDHSLRLAMRRLAADGRLREQLGRAGRAYWEREHSVARMVAEYERLLERAVTRPAPRPSFSLAPASDSASHLAALLAPFGDLECELF